MTFFIRADASTMLGIGHVMRTLVLAKKLSRQGGDVVYLTKPLPGNLDTLIQMEGFGHISLSDNKTISEADQILEIIHTVPASVLIIDHYGIDFDTEHWIKKNSTVFLMVFDDTDELHHADILLNQNIYARKEDYISLVPSNCNVFAGAEYALLRDEFLNLPKPKRIYPDQGLIKVLVTLGGSDPDNITLNVMKALESIADVSLHITVIIGSSNPYRPILEQFAQRTNHTFELKSNVTTMATIMRQNDIAITAAGSTVLETIACSLPSILITLAPNQERNTHYLCSHALALETGIELNAIAIAFRHLALNPILYKNISDNLEPIMIGSGIDRLIDVLTQPSDFSPYTLKGALHD